MRMEEDIDVQSMDVINMLKKVAHARRMLKVGNRMLRLDTDRHASTIKGPGGHKS